MLGGPDRGGGPLRAWRIDALAHAATWDSGVGAELFGGRWNPKGLRAVYCSLDPATCIVEAAVHRGFAVLDTQPHVLSCVEFDLAAAPAGAPGVAVLQPADLPNPAWLHGGVPSAGQQQFGAALDAASRGLRTALIERDDFASGTSSKSSKMVHGGLRYLEQYAFRLVREALKNPGWQSS
mgnify:CR=1 FL=1